MCGVVSGLKPAGGLELGHHGFQAALGGALGYTQPLGGRLVGQAAEEAKTFRGGSGILRTAWVQRAWGYSGVAVAIGLSVDLQMDTRPE